MHSTIDTHRCTRKSSERSGHPAVLCSGITKRFYFYEHRTVSLREWFIRRVLRQPLHVRRATFTLQNVHLRVEHGEAVALIGANGSGKSTLLRLIAGIYRPSEGSLVTHGRIASIIELGAGFHPELTGADNAALYASVLGLGRRELQEHWRDIEEFSEMGDVLDMPTKYYSSGMEARLAFSVAVCLEPDILLLDEVLAVGDRSFRERCIERLARFHARNGTIILVSHELEQVRELCSRAVWLERGTIRMDGPAGSVLAAYEDASDQRR